MAETPDQSSSRSARKNRRITKPAKPGVDPAPAELNRELAAEDDPRSWGDTETPTTASPGTNTANDERLKRDKPPHWG